MSTLMQLITNQAQSQPIVQESYSVDEVPSQEDLKKIDEKIAKGDFDNDPLTHEYHKHLIQLVSKYLDKNNSVEDKKVFARCLDATLIEIRLNAIQTQHQNLIQFYIYARHAVTCLDCAKNLKVLDPKWIEDQYRFVYDTCDKIFRNALDAQRQGSSARKQLSPALTHVSAKPTAPLDPVPKVEKTAKVKDAKNKATKTKSQEQTDPLKTTPAPTKAAPAPIKVAPAPAKAATASAPPAKIPATWGDRSDDPTPAESKHYRAPAPAPQPVIAHTPPASFAAAVGTKYVPTQESPNTRRYPVPKHFELPLTARVPLHLNSNHTVVYGPKTYMALAMSALQLPGWDGMTTCISWMDTTTRSVKAKTPEAKLMSCYHNNHTHEDAKCSFEHACVLPSLTPVNVPSTRGNYMCLAGGIEVVWWFTVANSNTLLIGATVLDVNAPYTVLLRAKMVVGSLPVDGDDHRPVLLCSEVMIDTKMEKAESQFGYLSKYQTVMFNQDAQDSLLSGLKKTLTEIQNGRGAQYFKLDNIHNIDNDDAMSRGFWPAAESSPHQTAQDYYVPPLSELPVEQAPSVVHLPSSPSEETKHNGKPNGKSASKKFRKLASPGHPDKLIEKKQVIPVSANGFDVLSVDPDVSHTRPTSPVPAPEKPTPPAHSAKKSKKPKTPAPKTPVPKDASPVVEPLEVSAPVVSSAPVPPPVLEIKAESLATLIKPESADEQADENPSDDESSSAPSVASSDKASSENSDLIDASADEAEDKDE